MQDGPLNTSAPSTNQQKPPPKTIGECKDLTYTSPSIPHKPVWIASYPGSGAEMVRDLVQALTGGLGGGSVYVQRDPPYMDCRSANAATCKTHWPVLPMHSPLLLNETSADGYSPTAIVLLRNPIHAFPSRLNHLWEVKTNMGEHTRQAPERAWNQWIQKSWKQQVDKYFELIHTWTNESFPLQVELLLAYEDLISQESSPSETNPLGAQTAQKLVDVLKRSNVRVVQGKGKVACLWRHTVIQKPKKKRAAHAYTPGYTKAQKDRILDRMETDLLRVGGRSSPVEQELLRLFQQYKETIQNSTRIIEY